MAQELVLVVDFGGQYNQLIARRVRENNVYCEIVPYTKALQVAKEKKPVGLIFTGGPASVYEEGAPSIDAEIFELNIPILGICYGAQLIAYVMGGDVSKAELREYGKVELNVESGTFLSTATDSDICWMSHGVQINTPPEGFSISATTNTCPVAAMENSGKKIYGVQFHPEVEHTPFGKKLIHNFLYDICKCTGEWTTEGYLEMEIENIRRTVGEDKKVLCAISGGVDSSVCAAMVHKAIGDRLTCIFVDTGCMRKNEGDQVMQTLAEEFSINVIRVNAADRFLSRLKGVTDPEQKRKIIGDEFIRVFDEEAAKLGKMDFLLQGTIYPDIIESGIGDAAVIKSHHNVGGLPEDLQFELLEPVRLLFKDEVRSLGHALGLPDAVVNRQPFPGPGLAVRCLGEVNEDKLFIIREADAIVREEIALAGLDKSIWQYFALLPNVQSVGVMGDERTYSHCVAIRAIHTTDAMTAEWAKIPYDVLEKISTRIVNEVPHVNRIVYDITTKPPATIEWE